MAMRIDLGKCKSDPERLLARVLNDVPDEQWPHGWTVKPQAKSAVFNETRDARWIFYDLHIDFLFTCWPSEDDPLRPMTQVAVECDSLAYHDLKPEQIEKDRWRDRKLASQGIFVLRYSGTQIMKNPKGVAEEILTTLECLCDFLDPMRHLVDWGSPVGSLQRYERLVINALRGKRKRVQLHLTAAEERVRRRKEVHE